MVGAFLHYLQTLAAKMAVRLNKILEFQESTDRTLYLVWVTEQYRIAFTFITLLIRID